VSPTGEVEFGLAMTRWAGPLSSSGGGQVVIVIWPPPLSPTIVFLSSKNHVQYLMVASARGRVVMAGSVMAGRGVPQLRRLMAGIPGRISHGRGIIPSPQPGAEEFLPFRTEGFLLLGGKLRRSDT